MWCGVMLSVVCFKVLAAVLFLRAWRGGSGRWQGWKGVGRETGSGAKPRRNFSKVYFRPFPGLVVRGNCFKSTAFHRNFRSVKFEPNWDLFRVG